MAAIGEKWKPGFTGDDKFEGPASRTSDVYDLPL